MTLVRMLRYHGSLNKGERAGFPDEEAQKLIDKGIAERCEPVPAAAPAVTKTATLAAVAAEIEQSPSQHKEDPPVVTTGGEVTEPTAPSKKR